MTQKRIKYERIKWRPRVITFYYVFLTRGLQLLQNFTRNFNDLKQYEPNIIGFVFILSVIFR